MSNLSLDVVSTDTKTTLNFTLRDSAGTAINITGFTIKLAIRKEGAGANTNNASNTCTITSAANGQFAYVLHSGDFPTVGTYRGQVHITFSDTLVLRVPTFIKFNVIESFL
jgi:hypothetical protein